MTIISHSLMDATNDKTPIQEFYSGQNILITGGTGFLGKLLIEKLLRSCPDISSVYVIIRSKRGQDVYKRIENLFDDPIFEQLKKEMPKFRHKVTAISGDCSFPGLGISATDRELLLREISIVFNVAATVRFDEKIKQACAINVNGIKEIMELCRNMEKLKGAIHVSTAFSNCNRMGEIDEKFYDPPITGDNVLKLTQSLDEKKLDVVTSTLLGDFPNTYTYTKCIAEQIVKEYGKDLPIGIHRPAIVISTYKEPVTGWIDNIFGVTGALVGGGAGLLRVMNFDPSYTAQIVPADLTVNSLIASAWDVANSKNEKADPPIYNYAASWNSNITWGQYMDLAFKHGKKVPSIRCVWCYSMTTTRNTLLYYLLIFLLHTLPALIIDFGLLIIGKETKALKLYKRIHKYSQVTSYFGKNKWKFLNSNTFNLWNKLNNKDKELFYFSMDDFDWNDYMEKCVNGLRLYIFKDDPKTIKLAREKMRRILWVHKFIKWSFIGFSLWIMYKLVMLVMSFIYVN